MRKLATEIANMLAGTEMLSVPVTDAIPIVEKILYTQNTDAIYAAARELIANMENQK